MPAEHLTPTPTLADLLAGYAEAPAIPVAGIASDSRLLGAGYLFLACKGMNSHGIDFLDQAIEKGVSAVAFDASTADAPANVGVPVFAVDDLAARMGEIANRYYDRPSEAMRVFGVTGTNGKTTVAWLIAQCAQLLGERCAYLGTLGHGLEEIEGEGGMTTPPVVELQGLLAGFRASGANFAALEVSSHGLSQGRVDGVRFEAALFTNLTRDHLDYHASMRDYFETKARLFLDCDPRQRIVNIDSEWGTQLAERCGSDVITVSTTFDRVANGRPYVFVRSVVAHERGSDVSFTSAWGDGRFSLPLPGDYNVANAATVLALMLAQGVQLDDACDVLSRVTSPPGRMQQAVAGGISVFIDYAHTPIAVEAALRALRAHCRGRLWCVFGCGGDRDAGKRPLMGKAAERYAHRIVITNDNPRTESPQRIIDEIVAGLARPERATVIEDRAAAIQWAVAQADATDVVLLAGKGHEDYQQIGDDCRPFSDYAVACRALGSREQEDQQ